MSSIAIKKMCSPCHWPNSIVLFLLWDSIYVSHMKRKIRQACSFWDLLACRMKFSSNIKCSWVVGFFFVLVSESGACLWQSPVYCSLQVTAVIMSIEAICLNQPCPEQSQIRSNFCDTPVIFLYIYGYIASTPCPCVNSCIFNQPNMSQRPFLYI